MSDKILLENAEFSNGTEYDIFLYSVCGKCKVPTKVEKEVEDISELCEIIDKMEHARFGEKFPVEIKLYKGEHEYGPHKGLPRLWHECDKFEPIEEEVKHE